MAQTVPTGSRWTLASGKGVFSPILFAVFIDGLARAVKETKSQGTLGDLKINILLFADDLVLIGHSRKELQKFLDIVFLYSQKYRLNLISPRVR